MASPTFSAGSIGAVLASVSLAALKNTAVYLDYSTKIEGQVTARVSTSASVTANSFTKNEAYHVYGSTTVSGSVVSGATSVVVNSGTGLAVGMKIVVENELRTISAVAGTTLTIDALINAHANGAPVYLIEREPTYPGVNALGGTASTTFSKTSFLSTGKWCFVLTNSDSSNAVTVEITASTIDGMG